MTRTWLARFIVVMPIIAVSSVGLAQDKKPATAPAPTPATAPAVMVAPAPKPAAVPTSGPAFVAKPVLPSGAPTAPVGTAKPVVTAAAVAAQAGTPPAPKPPTELDQLKFMLGKWRCEGRQFASPMFGPEHTFIATAEGKVDSDGFWNAFTYEEKKSKEHHGFKVHGLWGWDGSGKHFVRAAVSNDGNWDSATSPGLEADKLVWLGEFSGPMGRMPFRHTFTKKGDKEWGHMLEFKDPTGKWTPTEDVACKR